MEKQNIIVSVVVPIYNVEKYLKKCLDSIKYQTFDNYEVLLIDDGSTDESGKICDEFCNKMTNFKVVHQKNKGLSGARNIGLKSAKGKYIIFIDGDDYIDKKTLKYLVNLMEENTLECLSYGAIVVGGKRKNNLLQSIKRDEINVVTRGIDYLKNHIPLSTVPLYMFDRLFLLNNNLWFEEGIFYEDMKFTPEMMMKCKRFMACNSPLYYYVQRGASITNSTTSIKKYTDICNITSYFVNMVNEHDTNIETALKKLIPTYLLVCEEVFRKLSYDDAQKVKKERSQLYFNSRTYINKIGFKGVVVSIAPGIVYYLRNLRRLLYCRVRKNSEN